MTTNGNRGGSGWKVSDEAIINELLNRIASLSMELAVKDAYVRELETKMAPRPEAVLVEE